MEQAVVFRRHCTFDLLAPERRGLALLEVAPATAEVGNGQVTQDAGGQQLAHEFMRESHRGLASVRHRIEAPGGAGEGEGAQHSAKQCARTHGQPARDQVGGQTGGCSGNDCTKQAGLRLVDRGTHDKILLYPGIDPGGLPGFDLVQQQQLPRGFSDVTVQALHQGIHGLFPAVFVILLGQADGLQR